MQAITASSSIARARFAAPHKAERASVSRPAATGGGVAARRVGSNQSSIALQATATAALSAISAPTAAFATAMSPLQPIADVAGDVFAETGIGPALCVAGTLWVGYIVFTGTRTIKALKEELTEMGYDVEEFNRIGELKAIKRAVEDGTVDSIFDKVWYSRAAGTTAKLLYWMNEALVLIIYERVLHRYIQPKIDLHHPHLLVLSVLLDHVRGHLVQVSEGLDGDPLALPVRLNLLLPDEGGGERLLLLRSLRTTTLTVFFPPEPRSPLSLDGARLRSSPTRRAIFTNTRLGAAPSRSPPGSRSSDGGSAWYSGAPSTSSWSFAAPPGAGRMSPKSISSSMFPSTHTAARAASGKRLGADSPILARKPSRRDSVSG